MTNVMASLTWIDAVVAVVLLASVILSFARGLVREIASLAIWVIALVGASRLAHYPAEIMPGWLTGPMAQTAGFLIVFVLVLLLGRLVTMALRELVHASGAGGLDRFLGSLFGLARGGLIVVVLAVMAAMTSLPASDAWRRATSRPYLEAGIRLAAPWLPDAIEERLRIPGPASSLPVNQGGVPCVA